MATITKRRFDIEFCDETSGKLLARLERVPFDTSETVQSLREELEQRSGWKSFAVLVRKGFDGPLLNLSERDNLEDVVVEDESTSSLQQYNLRIDVYDWQWLWP